MNDHNLSALYAKYRFACPIRQALVFLFIVVFSISIFVLVALIWLGSSYLESPSIFVSIFAAIFFLHELIAIRISSSGALIQLTKEYLYLVSIQVLEGSPMVHFLKYSEESLPARETSIMMGFHLVVILAATIGIYAAYKIVF